MRELGKKMADMKGYWLIVLLVVVGMGLNAATAHDNSAAHNRYQKTHHSYDETHSVYCAWRHGYEGISCVHVGD